MTWSVYIRIGWSPYGERKRERKRIVPVVSGVIQDLRFPRLAPARLASVCGSVECLPRGFSCLNPFRSAWPVDFERLPFDPSKISRSRDESTQRALDPSTSSILPFDLQVRRSACLPPCFLSRKWPRARRFIYLDDTSCLFYDRLAWHVSRAAPIARVLPSDIYNGASRRLCIKFCSTRLMVESRERADF